MSRPTSPLPTSSTSQLVVALHDLGNILRANRRSYRRSSTWRAVQRELSSSNGQSGGQTSQTRASWVGTPTTIVVNPEDYLLVLTAKVDDDLAGVGVLSHVGKGFRET